MCSCCPRWSKGARWCSSRRWRAGSRSSSPAHTGGDDLVEEGRTGFTIPIRSPEAIAERLAWFADHRDALAEMRRHAIRKAAETSWLHYENRVLDAVRASFDLRRARRGWRS